MVITYKLIQIDCWCEKWYVMCRAIEFDEWMEAGGSQSSISCQNITKLLICTNAFPPCESSSIYGVYPCKETCLEYNELILELCFICSICNIYSTPFICPTDGPDYNATEIGHGIYPLSNNALQSCYTNDIEILPF